jgi:hypothetical protein
MRQRCADLSYPFGPSNCAVEVQREAAAAVRGRRGRVVQVDPIKHVLKAPKTKRLKVKVDESLSSFAFNFNLRR